MDDLMNRSQQVLHTLSNDGLVVPKALAFRLHKHAEYISDVCRRERVDFVAIFNEILRSAEPLAVADLPRLAAISRPIFEMLTDGTGWELLYCATADQPPTNLPKLCTQVSTLLDSVGGLIKSFGAIAADGKVDQADAATIEELRIQAGNLCRFLNNIIIQLSVACRQSEARK